VGKDNTSFFDVDQELNDEEFLIAWQSKCLDKIVEEIIQETGAENVNIFESKRIYILLFLIIITAIFKSKKKTTTEFASKYCLK